MCLSPAATASLAINLGLVVRLPRCFSSQERCRVEGLSIDSCPKSGPWRYERIYSSHVMDRFKGLYRTWDHFQASKSGYHKACQLEVFEHWKAYAEE